MTELPRTDDDRDDVPAQDRTEASDDWPEPADDGPEPADDDRADDVTGVFLHRLPENSWWWSQELFRLLGHEPDAVTPTAELLHRHIHPDDRSRLDQVMDQARATARPFSCYLRVVDTAEGDHSVVLVGDGRTDDTGQVVVLRGFVVDVTRPVREEARRTADTDIDRARATQEDIDLARGVLMALYGIDADVALRLLRRHSQHTNVKLRVLARAVRAAAPTAPGRPQRDLHQRMSQALYPPDRE